MESKLVDSNISLIVKQELRKTEKITKMYNSLILNSVLFILLIVGIGGINNKNYKSLIKFGLNYLAISSFIWNNPRLKPKEAIKKFN